MGDRLRSFDWTTHPLGPPEGWPSGLRTAVQIILASPQAMWVAWGDALYVFSNDAHLPALGPKGAGAPGVPAAQLWAEEWATLGPALNSVLRTGIARRDEFLRLILARHGGAEETFHTLALSPLPDESGRIGGVLGVATEETHRVLGERRHAVLQALAARLATVTTEDALFKTALGCLAERPEDVPFALVYQFDPVRAHARLAAAQGIEVASPLAPESLATQAATPVWPVLRMVEGSPAVVVDLPPERLARGADGRRTPPPRQALVAPLVLPHHERPSGFLVTGINPHRPLDPDYRAFLAAIADRIIAGLAHVRAYEAERLRAETLAELDQAKTAFFGHVSHELRTPLTLMLAPMEDLLKAPPSMLLPEVRDLVSVAHRNGLRLLKLVNTILDFSQIEAGRMGAEFAPTDLAQLTTELASSFRATIERAGLIYTVDCPPLEEPVHVDRNLWEKIVLHLISNAFKFTLEGEVRVSLRRVGDCVEFSVRDTGAGIPAEDRPHLFERFHRLRNSRGRTQDGTGIGLTLVSELVKLHGGTLHVDSEPGAGSTFTVFLRTGSDHLPREQTATGSGAPRSSSGLSSAFAGEADSWLGETAGTDERTGRNDAPVTVPASGGRVLVVDDNPDMRRYVSRLLSARFEVITAADGASALEIVRQRKPDLVLSDAMMPELDGFGLLRAIRSRAELRTIPVILLSARAGEESRIEGLDAGADDFLVKPFSARELLARVSVHLQMARIRGQAEERERDLRTRAEGYATALRESNERLSASLAAAGTGTFRWDLRSGQLDFDDSLNRLFGLSGGPGPRSMPEFVQLVHIDDRSRVQAAGERCLIGGEGFDLEFRVVRPDGSICWVEDKGRAFFDETGRAAYMTGACVDITKRKQAEMFVWRQKDVLEQIVQGAPLNDVLETLTLDVEQVAERKLFVMVTMVDASGRRLVPAAGRRCPAAWWRAVEGVEIGPSGGSCGAAAFRKERIIVRNVMTSPYWENYRTEAVKLGLRACWSTPIISSRGTVLGTFSIYYPDPSAPTEHELRFVDIVTRTAALAVERDQSEAALKESRAQLAEHAARLEERVQERTARLQETVSELESFSYSISHDMRAPLRAMQSFAQILAEDCADQIGPEGKDYIRRIVGASDRMDRLIQDVLTYSRVTRTEVQLEPVDVEKLLDGILESYPQFQSAGAYIEIRRPLPRVMGNEASLTQCLSNLIGNALKFVPPGTVPRIEVWAEKSGKRVRLLVRDNGIGIEPEAHEKIFRIFYQLDRSFEGTGIGLAVVRKAAERMGGSVGVKSAPNRGSTFHLDLAPAP